MQVVKYHESKEFPRTRPLLCASCMCAPLPQDTITHFYNSDTYKALFFDYITALATRLNPHTGMQYRHDPTILAWDLAMHASDPGEVNSRHLHGWIPYMSNFLRRMDPNHLVMVSSSGYFGPHSPHHLQYNPPTHVPMEATSGGSYDSQILAAFSRSIWECPAARVQRMLRLVEACHTRSFRASSCNPSKHIPENTNSSDDIHAIRLPWCRPAQALAAACSMQVPVAGGCLAAVGPSVLCPGIPCAWARTSCAIKWVHASNGSRHRGSLKVEGLSVEEKL